MPIQAKIERKKIQLTIKTWDKDNFGAILGILKEAGAKWSPETKLWSVAPLVWDDVEPQIQDYDDIVYDEKFDSKLKELLKDFSSIKFFDNGFSRKDLKLPPIKGKAPFENYQLEDIERAFNTNRYAFFNDPGTGKTYEYMSTINLQQRYRNAGKILFLTSNSGVYNMRKEFSKFTDISASSVIVGGVANRKPFNVLDSQVIVCNYRSFLLIHDEYRKKRDGSHGTNTRKLLKAIDAWIGDKDAILILDESHNIANPSALQTEAVERVKHLFEYIYGGSGTPADKLEKYYSQLKTLDLSLVHNKSFTDWKALYFNLGTKYSEFEISGIKPDMVEPLQNIIKSVSSRRLAHEVLDLKEHYTKKIYSELTPLHRRIYELVVVGALKELQERDGAIEGRSLKGIFPYLIMAIDHPKGLIKHFGEKITNPELIDLINTFDYGKDHAKVPLIKDILNDYPDEKFILWNSHPLVANSLEVVFNKYKPYVVNGETKIPKGMTGDEFKYSISEEFQNDPKRNLAIFSTQTMNSSLNMVKCRKAVIVDASYNYVEFDQFLKRIYRLGQTKDVTTFVPLLDRSMDITRRKILEDKDFVNKYFLSEKFLDKGRIEMLFNLEGD